MLASFEDYEGTYPYHCHLLDHEDHGMRRQFETTAVCGDNALARGFEDRDDGNVTDGDGCSSSCQVESSDAARAQQPAVTMTADAAAEPQDAAQAQDTEATRTQPPALAEPDHSSCSIQRIAAATRRARTGWHWAVPIASALWLRSRRRGRRPKR